MGTGVSRKTEVRVYNCMKIWTGPDITVQTLEYSVFYLQEAYMEFSQ